MKDIGKHRKEQTMALIVSAAEAAKLLKTDTHTVHRKLRTGEIPAYREGTNWKIPLDLLKVTIENRAIEEAKERKKVYEESRK